MPGAIRDSGAAIAALSALAQEHRLAAFRLLVEAGPAGLAAGSIAEALDLPPSSLSFHLAHLERAGLAQKTRHGRTLIYRARFETARGLADYLMENCCGGQSCAADDEQLPVRRQAKGAMT